jgi:hypothetical protein
MFLSHTQEHFFVYVIPESAEPVDFTTYFDIICLLTLDGL